MAEHKLFYYPYASFTGAQLPLLKVTALYFDKLVILDPVGASWDTIGADSPARDAVKQLVDAGVLETVAPSAVLAEFEDAMAQAIRLDMADKDFLELCEAHGRASGKTRWTLALAKVPHDQPIDGRLRTLMGDFARDVARKTAYAADDYAEDITAISHIGSLKADRPPAALLERSQEYSAYAESGRAYDEYREGYTSDVEYRYADFPLALGEAIMLNHALFAGLLHADATPITDDVFHSRGLALKLRRAGRDPAIEKAQDDRARERRIKADALAAAVLSDAQLALPILNLDLPIATILEYRHDHTSQLAEVREKLGWMARRIEEEPWTDAFAEELEHKAIPDIAEELNEARKARDSWLKSKRGRLLLSGSGIAVGAAAAVLSLFATPLTPVALATAGLGLASGTAIPGFEWLLDWRDGRKSGHENGLHYLLMV